MANENEFSSSMGGSRFDALLGGAEVDSELRSFLNGVPGVTLPAAAPVAVTPAAAPAPAPAPAAAPVAPAPQAAPARRTPAAEPEAPIMRRSAAPAMDEDDTRTAVMPVVSPQPAAVQPAVVQPAVVQPAVAHTAQLPVVHTPQYEATQYTETPPYATPQYAEAPQQYVPQQPAFDDNLPDFTEKSMQKPAKASRLGEIEHAMMELNPEVDPEFVSAVATVLDLGASDLHLVAESTPVVRIDGQLKSVADTSVWDGDRVARVIEGILTREQLMQFRRDLELDLAYSVGDIARFRMNVFQDQRGMGAALRIIPTEIKSVSQLGLPRELVELANLPRGMVLVCGPTGSGKSTTLAAIVDRANATRASHIVTVEDPIEFLHNHKRGIINQREVGADTHSFSDALKHALRQDPDIILVGELRDLETISTALTAAETGHLVFATLHTQDAGQTIDRIMDVFPSHQQAQVRTQLAATLRAVVVQTLLPRAGGRGRVVATEVMFMTPAIQALIRAGKSHQLRTALQAGNDIGMHTLDQDLARLVLAGDVEYGTALELAQDVAEFDQLVRNRGISRAAAGDLTPEGTRQTAGQSGAN